MHTSTFLTTLLLSLTALTTATPRGPPKPAKTLSLAALNTCGCDIPSFFIKECQNIPSYPLGSQDETASCLCSQQWYGYSDVCADCINNAVNRDEFPELVQFMQDFVSVTKQIYTGCSQPGGSVSSDGNSVCGHTFMGDSCAHIDADGKGGWVSFKGKNGAKGRDSNSSAEFELGEFEPKYKGQTLDLPVSGWPKEEEEKKKDDKKKDEDDEKDEDEKDEDEKDEKETDSSSSTTNTGGNASSKSGSNSTASTGSSSDEEDEEVLSVNADSGAALVNVKNLGFAAVFGLAIALFV